MLTEELHKGIDPETELPRLFAERRLAHLSTGGLNVDALKLTLRHDAAMARNDLKAAESLLIAGDRARTASPRVPASACQHL